VNVASDVLDGQNFRRSLKSRLGETSRETARETIARARKALTGEGVRGRRGRRRVVKRKRSVSVGGRVIKKRPKTAPRRKAYKRKRQLGGGVDFLTYDADDEDESTG
jgi:hypothetical protein